MRRLPQLTALFLSLSGAAIAAEPAVAPPQGAALALEATAQGVQIYTCTNENHWTFVAPEAALFDATGRQIGTHFAGPTWKMADGSQIAGEVIAQAPAPNAISWLLLRVKSHQGAGILAAVTHIRRIDTQGGIAPTTPCKDGEQARMQYSARYLFYTAPQ